MPRDTGEAAERSAIDQLRTETRALAHIDGCTAADQCAAMPLGEKACGGPEDYLVYCPRSTDVNALKRKAAELLNAERAFNKTHSAMSTCEMRLAPTAALVGGRCMAAPSTPSTHLP